ncbi:hypothetical protein GCM10010273_40000 [Streptomyces lavendulocolor]
MYDLSGTDPPCSPRGKWSLVATKVGPGGLDRAGADTQANKPPRKVIPSSPDRPRSAPGRTVPPGRPPRA